MGRFILSKAHDWKLENKEQDIRGQRVIDSAGKEVGTIQELIANTDSEMVESIVLDNGKEYPASDIEIGDDAVYLEGYAASTGTDAQPVVRKYKNPRIQRGNGAGYHKYENDFRRHHQESYATTGDDYDFYKPAYQYGATYGTNPTYSGRDYEAVEPDLRRDYEQHHGSGNWERVKDAARHAFNRARR